jgi:hypothetical protein
MCRNSNSNKVGVTVEHHCCMVVYREGFDQSLNAFREFAFFFLRHHRPAHGSDISVRRELISEIHSIFGIETRTDLSFHSDNGILSHPSRFACRSGRKSEMALFTLLQAARFNNIENVTANLSRTTTVAPDLEYHVNESDNVRMCSTRHQKSLACLTKDPR